jgi:hypothetical protein
VVPGPEFWVFTPGVEIIFSFLDNRHSFDESQDILGVEKPAEIGGNPWVAKVQN